MTNSKFFSPMFECKQENRPVLIRTRSGVEMIGVPVHIYPGVLDFVELRDSRGDLVRIRASDIEFYSVSGGKQA